MLSSRLTLQLVAKEQLPLKTLKLRSRISEYAQTKKLIILLFIQVSLIGFRGLICMHANAFET